MSKIYFNKGEKDILLSHININTQKLCNIELIKKHYKYKEILLKYTYIPQVLNDIIFEYSHEIIMINCNYYNGTFRFNDYNNIDIIIRIDSYVDSMWKYNINFNTRNVIDTLFTYYTVRIPRKSDSIPPKTIVYSKLRVKNIYDDEYPLEHFINYYMNKYYNKRMSYINNLDYPDDNYYGIYNNKYFQICGSELRYHYFHVIKMLNHKKIKQMIVIIKLFVNLLSKY